MELSPYREAAIAELHKNFPALYGTRRFITVFTRALHGSLFSVDQGKGYNYGGQ
jgi:hypothetical protein